MCKNPTFYSYKHIHGSHWGSDFIQGHIHRKHSTNLAFLHSKAKPTLTTAAPLLNVIQAPAMSGL